jgi:hypothetical protein
MRPRSFVWLGLLGSVAVACGGSGGASSDGASAFVGSWTSNGTQTEMCSGATHADPGTLSVTIVAGPSAGQITTQASGCSLNWSVIGAVATLAGNQTCGTVPGSVGGTWTPTFVAGTLTLDGDTITVSDSGNATYVNGVTQTCTFTQSGTYTKN